MYENGPQNDPGRPVFKEEEHFEIVVWLSAKQYLFHVYFGLLVILIKTFEIYMNNCIFGCQTENVAVIPIKKSQ